MRPGKLPVARAVRILLPALVVAYGCLLRFDALTLTHGAVQRPAWLQALQMTRAGESRLRPDAFRWQRWEGRYISDPYTYLQYAREPRSFYAAHRREPIFPFATKVSLKLLTNQDVAVSFASMFFSVLAIVATFVLGRYAFSYWIGLGAAAAMAIEYDLVTWGIGGWRDDAFTCAVVFSTWGMLRRLRIGSAGSAAGMGIVAGLACLVRITSLSFLVPGAAWALIRVKRPWRERVGHLAIAVAAAALVAGPYLVNCWRTFGDPLYAINVHADVYRAAEGEPATGTSQTASEYVASKLRARPWQTLDTALLGLTVYPFTNKWHGFGPWHPLLGPALSALALGGLFLFLGSREGRLMLLVLITSLVPYMLTWRMIFDWRFTQHVYPFFLIAAGLSIATLAKLAQPGRLRNLDVRRMDWRAVAGWSSAVIAVGALVWVAQRTLPVAVAKETLAVNESVSLTAGARDGAFFGEGWAPPVAEGNVTSRATEGPRSRLWLPITAGRSYQITIRMDPFPRPAESVPAGQLPRVWVFFNGRLLKVADLTWNPERVGAYTMSLPGDAVMKRGNHLDFSARGISGEGAQIRVWYVRIHPEGP